MGGESFSGGTTQRGRERRHERELSRDGELSGLEFVTALFLQTKLCVWTEIAFVWIELASNIRFELQRIKGMRGREGEDQRG